LTKFAYTILYVTQGIAYAILDFSSGAVFSAVNDICGDIVESFSDECHSEGGDLIDLQHPHQCKISRSKKKKNGVKLNHLTCYHEKI